MVRDGAGRIKEETTTHEERTSPNGLPFLFIAIIRRERKPPTTTQPTTQAQPAQAKQQPQDKPRKATARAKQSKKMQELKKLAAFRFSLLNRLTLHA